MERFGLIVAFVTLLQGFKYVCGSYPGCLPNDEEIYTDDIDIIYSPRYPRTYPRNSECYYIIQGDANEFIVMSVYIYSIQSRRGCTRDYLIIYDSNGEDSSKALTNRMCGFYLYLELETQSNYATIKFVSDSRRNFYGFVIEYEIITRANCPEPFDYTTDTGVSISSANYNSGNYPPYMDCTYTITAPADHHIVISVDDFDLENVNNCIYDYLRFTDDDFTYGTYCGPSFTDYIKSKENVLYVRFVSDESLQYRGFLLTWTFLPYLAPATGASPACLSGSPQTISLGESFSPLMDGAVYSASVDCQWLIQVINPGLELTFTSFDIEGPTNGVCLHDKFRVYAGPDDSSPLIAEFCESRSITTSGSNTMLITFHSDQTVQRAGFTGQVEAYTPPACGILGSARIYGGSDAPPNQYPWQASLQYFSSGSFYHICGGTLISENYVLTAAHCVEDSNGNADDSSRYRVVLGDHLLSNNAGTEEIRTVNIIMHPGWDSNEINKDYALLELSSPVPINEYILPACLSEQEPPTGTTCIVSGWGRLSSQGSSPNTLQHADMELLLTEDCRNDFGIYSYYITDFMICVNRPNVGTCFGDSGGPLVCGNEGVYSLYGVTSWLLGSCESSYPSVFARTTSVMNWIKDNTGIP